MQCISFSIGLPQLKLSPFVSFLLCSQSKQFNCLNTQCMQFYWKARFFPHDFQIGNIFALLAICLATTFVFFLLDICTRFQFQTNFRRKNVPLTYLWIDLCTEIYSMQNKECVLKSLLLKFNEAFIFFFSHTNFFIFPQKEHLHRFKIFYFTLGKNLGKATCINIGYNCSSTSIYFV